MAEQDKDLEQKTTTPDAETKTEADTKKQDESAKVETSKPQAPSPPLKNSTPETAAEPEKKQSRATAEQPKSTSKDTPPPKSTTPSTPKAPSTPEKKSGGGPAWLALLLALMAGGGAGYTYWLFSQYTVADQSAANDVEQRALQAIESQSGNISSEVKNITADVERQNQKIDSQDKLVREFDERLGATLRQVNEISHVSRRSWMLAEAEYLLRLANQRLVMERETTSPLALLKAADEILLAVDDVNLYPVRAELTREIQALRAVGRLDVEGIFLRLTALEQQVVGLELLSPESEAVENASEPLKMESDVVGTLKKAWGRLLDQVRIRHRNKPVEPLLSPEQHQYIQQNLRLMMEQAQLALLQQRTGVYRASLEKAEGWVTTYFQLNGSTDALLASLKELKEVNIAPELPDISPSLALLKQYLTNPDILLEQKNGADAPAVQAKPNAPESGGSKE